MIFHHSTKWIGCCQLTQSEQFHFSMCTNIRAVTPKLGATQNNLHTNYCFKDCILHCECRGAPSLQSLIKTVQLPPKSIKNQLKRKSCSQNRHTNLKVILQLTSSKLRVKFSFDIFQLSPALTSSTTNSWGWTHLNSI